MSDIILTLPHYHRHIAIYVVQIIYTILVGRVCFYGLAFYIAVCCGFDKHLYLTSCLNAHNHNTCIRLPQTGCTAQEKALFIISHDGQTQVLAANAMAATKIHDFRDHCHRQSIPLHDCVCNNPSDNITETRHLGTV